MAPVELSIGELLELSEIMLSSDTPENPARTRKMIDEAFQLLQKDKVIGFYDKVASTAPSGETTEQRELRLKQEQDTQKRIDQCAQGWWKLYVRQYWRFEPPSVPRTNLLANEPSSRTPK